MTNKAEGVNIITKGGQNEHTADGSTGAAALEGNQPGNLPADGGGQRPGSGKRGGRKADNERDESADADRDDEAGGLAGKPAPIHLPDEGSAGGVVSAGSGRAGEGDSSSSIEEAPASEPRTKTLTGTNPGNYRITEADNIGEGTRGQKIDANIAAIRLVKQLDKEGRYPTKEEQAVLAKYVGWGGLKSVFDKDSSKAQDQRARAELDFAIANGIPYGGWLPKGRKTEDGTLDLKYHLQEMPTTDYPNPISSELMVTILPIRK